jgi:hypothetical protein
LQKGTRTGLVGFVVLQQSRGTHNVIAVMVVDGVFTMVALVRDYRRKAH